MTEGHPHIYTLPPSLSKCALLCVCVRHVDAHTQQIHPHTFHAGMTCAAILWDQGITQLLTCCSLHLQPAYHLRRPCSTSQHRPTLKQRSDNSLSCQSTITKLRPHPIQVHITFIRMCPCTHLHTIHALRQCICQKLLCTRQQCLLCTRQQGLLFTQQKHLCACLRCILPKRRQGRWSPFYTNRLPLNPPREKIYTTTTSSSLVALLLLRRFSAPHVWCLVNLTMHARVYMAVSGCMWRHREYEWVCDTIHACALLAVENGWAMRQWTNEAASMRSPTAGGESPPQADEKVPEQNVSFRTSSRPYGSRQQHGDGRRDFRPRDQRMDGGDMRRPEGKAEGEFERRSDAPDSRRSMDIRPDADARRGDGENRRADGDVRRVADDERRGNNEGRRGDGEGRRGDGEGRRGDGEGRRGDGEFRNTRQSKFHETRRRDAQEQVRAAAATADAAVREETSSSASASKVSKMGELCMYVCKCMYVCLCM